ncbi:DM13 domain-containing protein [Terracoccus sp. 273MFTsu3.1]|uniref:DM13 domain-containing protein n=1 Tax=Terracoccus sp. 273MFTsu3.1 TaxID=1172188 RepID=UPI0003721BAB|nr:DM13 domain-containing protein [Terracoccus sp. 273MFTsu3.1]
MNRLRWIAAAVVTASVVLVVGLALFQPWRLLTRSVVDEPLPAAAATVTGPTPDEGAAPTRPTPSVASAAPRVIGEGRFVDGEHATSGTARVLELADGATVLRLEGFSTSDGPDVVVWLTDQPAGGDDWHRYDDGRFVPLGHLKGTDGNQNYAVPAGTDLSGLTSVVIWCDRFDVAFGSAPIRSA